MNSHQTSIARALHPVLGRILTRYFRAVVLLALAVSAYFQGRALSHLVAAGLSEADRKTRAAAVRHWTPRSSANATASAAALIARNPFDSVRGSLLEPAQPATPPEPVKVLDLSDPLRAPTCPGVRVDSTLVAVDPSWSSAVVQAAGETRGAVVRVGQWVGDKQVAFIGYNRVKASPAVWLVNERELCQATVFGETREQHAKPKRVASKPKRKPRAAKHSKRSKRAPPLPRDIAERIERVSATEYVVERSAVDSILENQQLLMRSVRIKPKRTRGRTNLVLSRVRKGTLLHEIGLRKGDELLSINGFALGSPEKALQAYARLRTADNLSVELERNGKPVTIDYRIQ